MAASATEFVIEPNPGRHIAQSFRELWAYRSLVLAFAERDIRVKYKQAFLGVAWAVVQPLALAGIFTFALGRVAGLSGGGGVPYAAFALSVLVPWTFIQTSVAFGASSLLTDSSLIRKVYFPREVPVLGAILGGGVDLAMGLGIFAVIGPLLGARLSWTWLMAPLLVIPLALLGSGLALGLAGLNVYYRDFRYVVPFALQLWLFASPVAYPLAVVPGQWRLLYVVLNPAAGVLDSFRRVLAAGQLPDPTLLSISCVGSSIIAVLGYRIFKALEPNFADVV